MDDGTHISDIRPEDPDQLARFAQNVTLRVALTMQELYAEIGPGETETAPAWPRIEMGLWLAWQAMTSENGLGVPPHRAHPAIWEARRLFVSRADGPTHQ